MLTETQVEIPRSRTQQELPFAQPKAVEVEPTELLPEQRLDISQEQLVEIEH